jgi:hypothetical protein
VNLADHPKIQWPPLVASSYDSGDIAQTETSERYVLKSIRLQDEHSQPPSPHDDPEQHKWQLILECEMPGGGIARLTLGRFEWRFAQSLQDKLRSFKGQTFTQAGAIQLES